MDSIPDGLSLFFMCLPMSSCSCMSLIGRSAPSWMSFFPSTKLFRMLYHDLIRFLCPSAARLCDSSTCAVTRKQSVSWNLLHKSFKMGTDRLRCLWSAGLLSLRSFGFSTSSSVVTTTHTTIQCLTHNFYRFFFLISHRECHQRLMTVPLVSDQWSLMLHKPSPYLYSAHVPPLFWYYSVSLEANSHMLSFLFGGFGQLLYLVPDRRLKPDAVVLPWRLSARCQSYQKRLVECQWLDTNSTSTGPWWVVIQFMLKDMTYADG